MKKLQCNGKVAIVESANARACATMSTIVLMKEGCGALLQYPSQLEIRLVEEPYGPPKVSTSPKKRKRPKERRTLNAGEEYQKEYHLQVRERLLKSYFGIIEAAKTIHYFPVTGTRSPSCTPTGSDIDFASMCSLSSLVPIGDGLQSEVVLKNDMDCRDCSDVFGRIISSDSDQELIITAMGKQFLIPPKSTFLLSDLSQITPLYEYTSRAGLYDLVVMDPPWENRSAIRGKKYGWLPNERLLNISMPRLAAPGAVVAVWVTNKRKLAMFVEHSLFPKWHVRYLTEWHWLKVTACGDLIHNMDSVHKKPYEVVVIGQYIGNREDVESKKAMTGTIEHHTIHVHDIVYPPSKKVCLDENPMVSVEPVRSLNEGSNSRGETIKDDSEQTNTTFSIIPTHHVPMKKKCTCSDCGDGKFSHKSNEQITPLCSSMELSVDSKDACANSVEKNTCECTVHTLPADLSQPFTFMCVASQTHSQKPYIGDILTRRSQKKYCRKLEMFARNLLPDWTSWGNEVLKFKNASCD